MKAASVWIAAIAWAAAAQAGPLAIGDPLPRAELEKVHGRLASLGSLGDSGALVVFHSSACEESRAWEPTLIELGNSATQRLVRTTIVDPDAGQGSDPQRAAAERGIRFGYVADADGAVARAFGASSTPEAFLFDGGGRLVYRGAVGTRAGETRSYLADALDAMLTREPVPIPVTAPAGCPMRSGE